MYPDHISERGFWPGAYFNDLIFQTAGGSDYAGLFHIGGQEILPHLFIARCFFGLGFLHKIDDACLGLLVVEGELVTLIDVVDGAGHQDGIDISDILLLVEIGYAEADGIAQGVLGGLQHHWSGGRRTGGGLMGRRGVWCLCQASACG